MQNTQCNCSNEREIMKRELDEATSLIDHLEDEVKRLHEDKQSLLMSFLNLQAASRSREPSRTGTDGSSGEEDSGDLSDTEDEESLEGMGDDGVAESGITDEEDEVCISLPSFHGSSLLTILKNTVQQPAHPNKHRKSISSPNICRE